MRAPFVHVGATPPWLIAMCKGDNALIQQCLFAADDSIGQYGYRNGVGDRWRETYEDRCFTNARSGTRLAKNAAGVYVSKASGTLVIPDGTGAPLFEARTNLSVQSQTFDHASWTKTNVAVTADQTTAPDGTNTADRCVDNSSTGVHQVGSTSGMSISASTVYTWSVFLKRYNSDWVQLIANDGFKQTYVNVNLATGTLGFVGGGASNGTVEAFSNGWYRVTNTFTSNVSSTAGLLRIYNLAGDGNINAVSTGYAGDGVKGFYAWGAQAEAASFVGPYIPTISSAVTVGADIRQMIGPAAAAALAAKGYYSETFGVAGTVNTNSLVAFVGGASAYFFSSTNTRTNNGSGDTAEVGFGSGSYSGLAKVAAGWGATLSVRVNGSATGVNANSWAGNTGNVYDGNSNAGNRALNGYRRKQAFFATTNVLGLAA